MVDVFGRSRSYSRVGRGLRGPPGRPGISDLCQWLPKSTVNHLRKFEESGCFLLDLSSDIVREGKNIIKWVSRSEKGDFQAVHPATSIFELPDGGKAVEFDNCRYHCPREIFECRKGSGFLCITFQTDVDHLQTLVGNYKKHDPLFQNHEITLTGSEIFVTGYLNKKPMEMPIHNDNRKWTTLFLQFSVTPGEIHFKYIINATPKMSGEFSLSAPAACYSQGITLGSRKDDTQKFSGKLHAVEFYFTSETRDRIPEEIVMLVSKQQIVRHV
jgi:hypothetical protein